MFTVCDNYATEPPEGAFERSSQQLCFGLPSLPPCPLPPSLLLFLPIAATLDTFIPIDEPSSLQALGIAASVPALIRLGCIDDRDANAAFYSTPLQLFSANSGSFSTNFSITGYQSGWGPSADGMTFFLSRTMGIGLNEWRLWLPDPNYSPFVAVEFDVWQDSALNDPNNNHMGIDSNSLTSLATATPPFEILGGSRIYVWVEYVGADTQLKVYATTAGPTMPSSPLMAATVDVFSALQLASSQDAVYFGFSFGSGGSSSLFSINSWCLSAGEHGSLKCESMSTQVTSACHVPPFLLHGRML